jgi:hypothetical protein
VGFLVLWMRNNDKFDNLSSPIVALRQFFARRIALNERSLDAEDTHFRQLIQSLIPFVRILATDKRLLMKLLGGKHAGIWLMGKKHKHYWRHSMSQTKTCIVKNKLCFILCQDKAFEDKMN